MYTKLTSYSGFIGVNVISRGSSSSRSPTEQSSTFISTTWFSLWEDVRHVSLHEPSLTFRKSMQFCKINKSLSVMLLLSHSTNQNTLLLLKIKSYRIYTSYNPGLTGFQKYFCVLWYDIQHITQYTKIMPTYTLSNSHQAFSLISPEWKIMGDWQSIYLSHKIHFFVHSVQQKSSGLIFCMSQSGSDMRYSSHHNSSHFTFAMFVHSWRFSVFHSLQSITLRIF